MKHLFFYIVCFFMLFNTLVKAENIYELPADFQGPTVERYVETIKNDEPLDFSMGDWINFYLETGVYLYNKYTSTDLKNEDAINIIRPFFPNKNDRELASELKFFNHARSMYDYGKQVYTDYINKKITSHLYRKVHSLQDYDQYGEVPYIQAKDDEFIKVYNFKKFLTYSHNPEERAAIEEFKNKNNPEQGILSKIDNTVQKIDRFVNITGHC